ncbi:MAG: hypothetical protein LBC58_05420 [Clostridiales Family XIII bacterium]|jgi:hypothetical protein|nr:hypothetical protein [Clostridiales Family XIII bacterium]
MFAGSAKLNTQIKVALAGGAAITALALLLSLPLIGSSAYFAAGLAAGIAGGALCVFLMKQFLELAASRRKAALSFVGFILRAAIFGGVFYSSLYFGGYVAGCGCAIAFVAPYAGAATSPYLQRLAAKVAGIPQPPRAVYAECFRDEAGRRRHVFIKNFDMVSYHGGRKYITHRSFRRFGTAGAAGPQGKGADFRA